MIANLSCFVGFTHCVQQLRFGQASCNGCFSCLTASYSLTTAIALGKKRPPDVFCSASPYVPQFRLKLLPVFGCRLVGKSKPHCLSQKNNSPNCFQIVFLAQCTLRSASRFQHGTLSHPWRGCATSLNFSLFYLLMTWKGLRRRAPAAQWPRQCQRHLHKGRCATNGLVRRAPAAQWPHHRQCAPHLYKGRCATNWLRGAMCRTGKKGRVP